MTDNALEALIELREALTRERRSNRVLKAKLDESRTYGAEAHAALKELIDLMVRTGLGEKPDPRALESAIIKSFAFLDKQVPK